MPAYAAGRPVFAWQAVSLRELTCAIDGRMALRAIMRLARTLALQNNVFQPWMAAGVLRRSPKGEGRASAAVRLEGERPASRLYVLLV